MMFGATVVLGPPEELEPPVLVVEVPPVDEVALVRPVEPEVDDEVVAPEVVAPVAVSGHWQLSKNWPLRSHTWAPAPPPTQAQVTDWPGVQTLPPELVLLLGGVKQPASPRASHATLFTAILMS
jgi:hypothetical protein